MPRKPPRPRAANLCRCSGRKPRALAAPCQCQSGAVAPAWGTPAWQGVRKRPGAEDQRKNTRQAHESPSSPKAWLTTHPHTVAIACSALPGAASFAPASVGRAHQRGKRTSTAPRARARTLRSRGTGSSCAMQSAWRPRCRAPPWSPCKGDHGVIAILMAAGCVRRRQKRSVRQRLDRVLAFARAALSAPTTAAKSPTKEVLKQIGRAACASAHVNA